MKHLFISMNENRYRDPDLTPNLEDTKAHMGSHMLSVEILRFLPHERDLKWKIGMGVVVVLLVLFCVLTSAWTMLAALIVFIWVYYETHKRPDDDPSATLECMEQGFYVHDTFHPYNQIESYYFIVDPDVTSLQFTEKGKKMAHTVLYLRDRQSILDIKKVLHGKVKENDTPPSDRLHRFIRFIKL